MAMDDRPDPDRILEQIQEETQNPKGTLKIFLGYAAGVGKTYTMLQAAHNLKQNGQDVIAGYIEPHDRPETAALMEGLEILPHKIIVHQNIPLKDFDIDGCLRRKPQVVLVDELAHTNAPGMRHTKRWQDVQELLDQGISVFSTMNIQHLDSMNDVVSRVSGIQVREILPDFIFDGAEEVEIIDIPPEELLDRLRAGKIYEPSQAERAVNNFFRKENLLALRELTLRRTADRVGKEVDSAREREADGTIWPIRERLLVSISPSPTSEDLLRSSARMASSLNADLLAVYIETPRNRLLNPQAKSQLEKNFATAESLGAETVILQGDDIPEDLVTYARKRNVTKLVIGKNRDPRWKRLLKRSIGDELIRLSGDIDIYVISGTRPKKENPPSPKDRLSWRSFVWTTVISLGFLALAVLFHSLKVSETNLTLTLLLGVVITAGIFGRSASIYSTVLAVLGFNFFFTTPYLTFQVDDPQYLLVFMALLLVGVVIGTLAERLQEQTRASREREHRMEALYRLGRDLAGAIKTEDVIRFSRNMISSFLEVPVSILIPDANGGWEHTSPQDRFTLSLKDQGVFTWVISNKKRAGWGTSTLSESNWQVWPLISSQKTLGIMAIPRNPGPGFQEEQMILLDALSHSVAQALERVELIQDNRQNALEMEAEKSRNTLLQGLSHDLRTPLAVISGASSTLLETAPGRLSISDVELLNTIFRESQWMGREVESLLSLTRLSGKILDDHFLWVPLEELFHSVTTRFSQAYPKVPFYCRPPSGSEICLIDPSLMDQALFNLLENGAVYADTPEGLILDWTLGDTVLQIQVMDRGPGIPPGEKKQIFRKFSRGSSADFKNQRGNGIGLALVQTIVQIHHGKTWVEDREGGGSTFRISIPQPYTKPSLPDEVEV